MTGPRAALAGATLLIHVAADASPAFDAYRRHRRDGERAFAKARWEEALASFAAARDVAPCDEAYVNVLRALHNLGRLDRMLEVSHEAIATRQGRLDALVDGRLYMFQERALYAEILSTAIFAAWVCDARAARAGADGATPADRDILARCGGAERARAIPELLCRDVDGYVADRVEEYLRERVDSGFHDPMVYRAARGVARRRADEELVDRYARLEEADRTVAAVEREHGATPFLPTPRDLERSVPKWLAVADAYDGRGFPELAAQARGRAAQHQELAASADTPQARAAEVARRRRLQASARSDWGPVEAPPGLADTPLVPQPRAEVPAAPGAPSPAPPTAGIARATFRLAVGEAVRERTLVVGPAALSFDLSRDGGRLSLRVNALRGAEGARVIVRIGAPDVEPVAVTVRSADAGRTFHLGEALGPGGPVDVEIDVEIPAAPGVQGPSAAAPGGEP